MENEQYACEFYIAVARKSGRSGICFSLLLATRDELCNDLYQGSTNFFVRGPHMLLHNSLRAGLLT